MTFISRARTFFHSVFRPRRVEEQLDAELRSCFEMLVERYTAQGMPLDQARRTARQEFGSTERIKEEVRDVRVGGSLESFPQDLRYAWRSLRNAPGFTAIAALTLILGIGINTAVFSLVYTALLRPLPYDRPGQLVVIWSTFDKSAASRAPTSGVILDEIRHRNRSLQDVAGIWTGNATFTGQDNPEQVKVGQVTPNFLSLLGVRPTTGRLFTPDEQAGGRPAVILTNGLWKRRFAADPHIVGKPVGLGGALPTVVGVLPENFRLYFASDANVPADSQAFIPFPNNIYKGSRTLYYIRVAARLKPGVTLAQAQQDLNFVASQIRGAYTEFADEKLKLDVVSMHDDAVHDLKPALLALFAGAVFVMLICCVNLANLVLARAGDRRREIALRSALGASHGRVLRQLLSEGVILSGLAAVAGLLLGYAGIRGLLRLRPEYALRLGDIGVHWPVVAFVAGLSIAAVLLCGLTPGIESLQRDLTKTLRESARAGQTPARRGIRSALIVCEITLGFMLVIGAGLMIRTFTRIGQVRPGFDPRQVLTFQMELSGRQFRPPGPAQFLESWESELTSLPGVEAAGAISHLPFDDYPNWYSAYRPEGVPQNAGGAMLADYRCITPNYLRTVGTRLLEGRFFDARDTTAAPQVVIVDETLARSAWPGQSAIGKKIEGEHITNRGFVPVWAEVVGVVEDVRNHSLSRQLRAEIYIPYSQSPRGHVAYAVRTRGNPMALTGAVRQLLHQRDDRMAVSKLRPMSAYLEQAQAPAGFTAVLAGIFAAAALLLAAIGVYGVVCYSVSRRMHEMGIRMALGATTRDVLQLVMREGLLLTLTGVVLGLAGAVAVSRELNGLVYGVSTMDPFTYGVALAALPVAAALGCLRPARRAAAANPLDAIRNE